MSIFNKKTIEVPTTQSEILEAAESWIVRWESRCGQFSYDWRKECEVFLSKEDANRFAESLRNAFNLLKFTYGIEVVVEKN